MLGQYGMYTLIDVHQDVASAITCGHGFPLFHVRKVLANFKNCPRSWKNFFLGPTLKNYGVCKAMSEYKYKVDEDGLPLKSECNKVLFIKYYGSKESMAIFEALYQNHHGF